MGKQGIAKENPCIFRNGLFSRDILYPLAINIWVLYMLRIFHGITFGVITTVKGTICAELIPSTRRGEGLSYFSLAMSLAMVLVHISG